MKLNTFMFTGTMVLTWILVVFASCLVPFFSRKDTAFGISVPESEYHSEFLTKLRYHYFISTLIWGILLGTGSLLSQLWVGINIAVWVQTTSMFVYIAIAGIMYLAFYFKVRKYKQNSNWKILSTVSAALTIDKHEKGPICSLWFLSYAVVILGITAVGFVLYPSLPDQMPMHYNAAGQVNRYAAKSISTILAMPIFQIIMALLFFGIYYAILQAKNQSSGGDAEEELKKGRAFKAIMSKFIFFIGLAVILMFGITQLSILGLIGIGVTLASPIVLLVIIFALTAHLMVEVGQGGSRMGSSKSSLSKAASDDDKNWILGTIYFNKEDPSLFVQKRFGLGYTVNIGNPIGSIIMVAVFVLIIVSLALPFILR